MSDKNAPATKSPVEHVVSSNGYEQFKRKDGKCYFFEHCGNSAGKIVTDFIKMAEYHVCTKCADRMVYC